MPSAESNGPGPDEAPPRNGLRRQRAAFRKLKEEGRRLPDDPIARRLTWPDRFDGTWRDFVDFSRSIDPLEAFDRTRMAKVSRWNSATINRELLTYNFRPKTEWPDDDDQRWPPRNDAQPVK